MYQKKLQLYSYSSAERIIPAVPSCILPSPQHSHSHVCVPESYPHAYMHLSPPVSHQPSSVHSSTHHAADPVLLGSAASRLPRTAPTNSARARFMSSRRMRSSHLARRLRYPIGHSCSAHDVRRQALRPVEAAPHGLVLVAAHVDEGVLNQLVRGPVLVRAVREVAADDDGALLLLQLGHGDAQWILQAAGKQGGGSVGRETGGATDARVRRGEMRPTAWEQLVASR